MPHAAIYYCIVSDWLIYNVLSDFGPMVIDVLICYPHQYTKQTPQIIRARLCHCNYSTLGIAKAH